MGQACVQRWKDTGYPKEADGGAEMLDTYTKLDVIPGLNVMSLLIELQIKCSGNIRRKVHWIGEWEDLARSATWTGPWTMQGRPHRWSCQHGECACSKATEIGKYMALGGMVLGWEESWNVSLKVYMGAVEWQKKIHSEQWKATKGLWTGGLVNEWTDWYLLNMWNYNNYYYLFNPYYLQSTLHVLSPVHLIGVDIFINVLLIGKLRYK